MIDELRHEFKLEALLKYAKVTRSTFYYQLNRMKEPDKYKKIKEEITAIYHENKGRYGYRRMTMELHNRGFCINHKTVRRLMKELGIWKGDITDEIREPIVAHKGDVSAIHTTRSGLFILEDVEELGVHIRKGTYIGKIVNPLTGEILEDIISPKDGFLFTLREHPVVYKGAIVARICAEHDGGGLDA